MKTLERWSVLLALALVANALLVAGPWADGAYACSCASSPLKNEIRGSDAVFSGEVRSIEEGATPDGPLAGTAGGIEATGKVSFAVRDSWKGVAAETVEVYGQGDGGNCYNVFQEGEAYVVYASRGGEQGESAPLENNACGASKPLADAEKDLRLLGTSVDRLPDTGGPALPVGPVPLAAGVILISIALVLLDRARLWPGARR